MKYAIRIMNADTGEKKLFAIAKDADSVIGLRYFAKKTIPFGLSMWIKVERWGWLEHEWRSPDSIYFDFSAGDLF